MSIKDERMKEHLRALAAEFINRHSTRLALITVTGLELSSDQKNVRILLSVMPREKEYGAIDFANRHIEDFLEYIKKNSKLRFLPHIQFVADLGEQNRQRVSELLETVE